MSCSGHINRSWCNVNSNNVAGRMPCPGNIGGYTDVLSSSVEVKGVHVNELRTQIRLEENRRGRSQTSFGTNVSTNILVSVPHLTGLRGAIDVLFAQTCPCNCDNSCPCHAHSGNYCSCNCNHAACLCNCANACTCQCHFW
jgi:hypothetical protein